MAPKNSDRDNAHTQRDTGRSPKTGNINERNNNQDANATSRVSSSEEPNVNADNPGIGDSTWNDEKLTNYTLNHSSEA